MASSSFALIVGLLATQIHAADPSVAASPEINWLTGEGVSFQNVLFPHFHVQAAYGETTADDLSHFAPGHHDPSTDGWTIQGIEAGLSFKPTEWFEAFGSYHLYQDARTRDWDGKLDEAFGRFKNLPFGLELRGGRYLNRFGLHNSAHLHGWSFIDQQLVNGRFLGDDGLSSFGGEIAWHVPTPWTSMLSLSYGEVEGHDAHAHEVHDHDHEGYEGDDAGFDRSLVTLDWTNQWNLNDFHQFRFGVSGAWGENRMGGMNQVYGLHAQYEWRENGLEKGGRYFRWRTEAMIREVKYAFASHEAHEEDAHHEDHDHHDHDAHHDRAHHEGHDHESHDEGTHEAVARVHRGADTEFGIYTALHYGWDNGVEVGLRADYVSGLSHADLEERYRVSPSLSYYLNPERTLYVRGQYNYDHSPAFRDEHSVWLQLGFNWGGSEVR